jgi:hypothetical protein
MMMTDGEIVKNFREAKNKSAQIGILAELNATSEDIIKTILKSKGVDLRSANAGKKKKSMEIEAADPVPGEAGYEADKEPPLGIAPRELAEQAFNESRICEIIQGMNRYYEASMSIPQAWREELKERL